MTIAEKTSRKGPPESDMSITSKTSRAGPAQSGMVRAEKGNDENVAEGVSKVFQKIQNDIIHLNLPSVPTKTSLEEGRWSESQECMRVMEQRFSECV
jgi:hypothetical protein